MADNLSANCDNYLHINGESNINQFSFRYHGAGLPEHLTSQTSGDEIIEITIPVKEFEASNRMMYEDFLILMNASEYPRIKVSFSKQQLKKSLQYSNVNCPDVRITIAGITRIYKIQCSLVKCADDLYLRGEEMIRLSDFKLKPPAKLLGMVKVNNEINVNFGFIITFTDNNQLSLAP